MFSSTDINPSMAFLASFFRGLSLTSLVGLRLWLSMARVQDLRAFSLVSHRAQFLVTSSSFSTLHLSAFWLKFIQSPTSLLLMTHSYVSPVLLIRYTPLPWPCRHASLTWRPGWHQNKLKMNDDKTEALLVKSDRTSFLTLGPTSIRVGTADISFMICAQKPWFHDFRQHASWQAHFNCLQFCLRGNQTHRLCPPVPDCWSNQNSHLYFCSLQVGLLHFFSIWLPTLPSQYTTESSKLCNEASFQSTQTWSSATSSANSLLVTGPSQNRLQTINYLSHLLLWLISCLFLWPFRWVGPFVLLQTHGILRIPHVRTETFGQRCIS